MDSIKELLINRNYKPPERLHPRHGFILLGGMILLVAVIMLTAGTTLTESLNRGDITAIPLMIHLPFLLLGIGFVLVTRMRWRDLRLRIPGLLDIGGAFVLALVAFIGAFILAVGTFFIHKAIAPDLLNESIEQAKVLEKLMVTTTVPDYLVTLLFLALIPALVEEFMFRGLLMDAFMRWGPFWAILASGVIFGIAHEMPSRIPSLIFVGVVLGWFKYKTGKLSASILMHFIYNSVVVTFGLLVQKALT